MHPFPGFHQNPARAWLVPVLVAALACISPRASAQSAEQVAAAESAFREGKELLGQGKVKEACAKLEVSQELDPGTGTLLNLGDCYERLGRTASAWGAFSTAVSFAQRAQDKASESEARRRVTALDPRVPRVRFLLPSLPQGLTPRLVRDGKLPLDLRLVGMPLPLDPGPHTVELSAEGYRPSRVGFTLRAEGKTVELRLPPLTPLHRREVPPPNPPAPLQSERSLLLPALLGGVAVAGVGLGVGFGVLASSQKDEAYKKGCHDVGGQPRCPQAGYDTYRDALTSAWVSTIAGGVGLLSGAAALYFILTPPAAEAAPPPATAAISLRPAWGGLGLSLDGSF